MRKLRLIDHISLDGVMEPGEPGDYSAAYAQGAWTSPFRTPEGLAAILEAQGSRFDLVLGRRTYDLWSGYWPKVQDGPIAPALNAATGVLINTYRAVGPLQTQ